MHGPTSVSAWPSSLTCDGQGEVLCATGLAEGVVGTAGIDAAVLGACRLQGQVPLLAADCVVALPIGEGEPIAEPLVGGSAESKE